MKKNSLFTRLRKAIEIRFLKMMWQIFKKLRLEVTLKTEQGKYRFRVTNDDPIHKQLFLRKTYELDFIFRVMAFLQKEYLINSNQFIDIGANNGVITFGLLLNRFFEKSIAIEPEPSNFMRLEKNVELNHLSEKVELHNFGLSDQIGRLEFELSEKNFGDHRVRFSSSSDNGDLFDERSRKTISINCTTLDDFFCSDKYHDIDLIWIDIQGFEPNVFKGGKNFFKSQKKVVPVISEFWPYGMIRAGINKMEFFDIVTAIFSHFFVWRHGRFLKYRIEDIALFWDEMNFEAIFDNVIYVNENHV